MTLTIDLPDELSAALAAKARARGLSAEQYAWQVLENDIAPDGFRNLGKARDKPVSTSFPAKKSMRRSPLRGRARREARPQPGS